MRYLTILWCVVVGCVKPAEVTMCGDFTCGLGAICSPDGTRCVAPETVNACSGLADGDRCTYTGISDGVCTSGICVSGGCGNGILEAALGEICDDGNFISGDGCRGDCLSAETCGDGIADLAAGELCDCGSAGMTVAGCDDKPNSDDANAICRTDCKPARCGDGIEDKPGEACDDGNTEAGDGCRADCGGRWTQMQSNTFTRLRGVWAASSTDAWAVGDNKIVRWNGVEWSVQPFVDNNPHIFKAVCGLSPTDVFVIVDTTLYRYQGAGTTGTWTAVPSTGLYETMWCRGSDIWVGGKLASNAAAYAFWNGTSFSVGATFDMTGESRFWRSTDGHMFATDQTSRLYHARADLVYWYVAGDQTNSPVPPATSAVHIAGTTSSDITVAYLAGTKHFAGTAWTSIPNGTELSPNAIAAVPMTTPTQTIHVGNVGSVLVCTAATCTPSLTPTEQNLLGLWSIDEKHAFVVGDHGTILY